jgi:hypothetical protein
MANKKRSNGMKIFLGIALAIIFFGLFNLGVSTFYPGPEYSDYCYDFGSPKFIDNCTQIDGCNNIAYYEDCNNQYNEARDDYNNNIFYVFVIAGLVLAIVGLFIAGLSFQIVWLSSGVALIIEGIIRNLNDKIPAFIAGVIVFIILSYFVYKKVED